MGVRWVGGGWEVGRLGSGRSGGKCVWGVVGCGVQCVVKVV